MMDAFTPEQQRLIAESFKELRIQLSDKGNILLNFGTFAFAIPVEAEEAFARDISLALKGSRYYQLNGTFEGFNFPESDVKSTQKPDE